ncbi:MAG: hypothetical protein H7066_12395 [Cytophagaceae bacterium]|nr:hypothetical protein [Gemmatimonadaceae bacterium]
MLFVAASIALQLSSAATPPPTGVGALVARARAARLQQDSLLASYQVVVRQRLSSSIGLVGGVVGLGPVGINRLAARFESVARVGWHHRNGAWGEILAARGVAPIVGQVEAEPEADDIPLVLPYFPGRDRLWPMSEMREALPGRDDWIAHPLSPGADSLYVFTVGDSLIITLPDNRAITLREIRVQPRRPADRLIVGSLWIDAESGSLVRAAYRPSIAMDLWPFFEREVGRGDRDNVKKFGPFKGLVREIVVDHGLYDGRFWLPRTRLAHAEGTARVGRATITVEQTFKYERVTSSPPGTIAQTFIDAPDVDPRTGRLRRPTWRGTQQRSRKCRETGDSTSWSPDSIANDPGLTIMSAEGVRFRVLLPCDTQTLATSTLLPPSIYSSGEALFTGTDLDALRKDVASSLAMSRQARWSPQPPTIHWGVDREMLRFNRVEGLSAGAMVERELGNGYTFSAMARLGVADWQPNAELSLRRTNVSRQLQVTAYRRLVASNDWGRPLGGGASLVAALFGRDDGFYYRTVGGEVGGSLGTAGSAVGLAWRLFGEQQSRAEVETQHSLAHAVNGLRFRPNIVATEGTYAGGATTLRYGWGIDPRGTRLSGSTRLEAMTGERAFGRGMTDMTIVRGLFGRAQATITGAAGTSVGDVSIQRLWYLGGPQTVHGHAPGAATGNAFWLARAELTGGKPLIRPVLFGDVGWAGPRASWGSGTPVSGAGVGLAVLDGAVRFDVGRAMESASRGRWRVDLYIELR